MKKLSREGAMGLEAPPNDMSGSGSANLDFASGQVQAPYMVRKRWNAPWLGFTGGGAADVRGELEGTPAEMLPTVTEEQLESAESDAWIGKPIGFTEETALTNPYLEETQAPAAEEQPAPVLRGGGGRAKPKPNYGLDIGKKLSFLPEFLRPLSEAYLPPDFGASLDAAFNRGEISEEDYAKAKSILQDYENKSVFGTATGAERAKRDVEFGGIEDEAELMEIQARGNMQKAASMMELAERLETSGLIEQAAEKRKKRVMEQQIGLIRSKIAKIENRRMNPFGDGWGALFGVMSMAIGTAGAFATKTPQMASNGIMQIVNTQMQKFQMESQNLKTGLQGEYNIYQLMRQDLQDDRAAAAAARRALINKARVEVEALGLSSSSQLTRTKASQLSASLLLHERAAEKDLLAQLTAKAEAEKAKALARGRGAVGKIKKNSVKLLETNGMPWSEPEKGKQYVQYRAANGQMMGGFAYDQDVQLIQDGENSLNILEDSLLTLERLHKEGSWAWSDADRHAEKYARNESALAAKQLYTMGALDKGALTAGEKFMPEVLGPWTNMPGIGGQIEEKLEFTRQKIAAARARYNQIVGRRVRPGYAYTHADPETGQAQETWVHLPNSPAGRRQAMEAAHNQANYVNPRDPRYK